MLWQKDEVTEAFTIFMKLLKDGKIKKQDGNDYFHYKKDEVQDIIHEVIEKTANVKIFESDETLYMVPNMDNELLSYTNEELRNQLGLPNNNGLYLAHFFILTLLAKFYNSEDLNMSTRQYVTIDEMEQTMEKYIEEFRAYTEEEREDYYQENGLDIEGIVDYWDELPKVNELAKGLKRAKSKIGFIYKVLTFLENEDLVRIYEDVRIQIRLTQKMEMLVIKYYYNSQRKEKIMELLKQ